MDQAKQHQSLQSLNQFMKPRIVKKIAQLILSAYVFSFFFSYSSWLSNFHFYITFPLQLFSHTIDRKCMFLICNGILVFLATNSGLFKSSPPESHYIDEFSSLEPQQVQLAEKEVLVVESNGSLENVVVEEEIEDKFIISSVGEEHVKVILEDEGGETDNGLLISEKREEIGQFYNTKEEENGDHDQLLSTEELNKKFDDFIRRMKEDIRIEARQQLVLVK